jgi:peptidoglycan/LPS O-acetylase OafA/YrhL
LSSTKHYFSNLDASRFIAFVAVFLTHTFYSNDIQISQSSAFVFVKEHLQLGTLALHYFFVLSSFLITWIILEEYKNTGNFNPLYFLARRSLRIWPLYFLIVAIGFIVAYLFSSNEELPPISYFLTFTLNFYIASNGYHFLFFLVFLWSISVEEQFYFFWAFVLKHFKSYIVHICTLLILVSLFFRYYFLDNDNQLMFNTLSSLSDFAIGALAAYIAFFKHPFFNKIIEMPRGLIVLVYVIFIANVALYHSIYANPTTILFENLIFAAMYAFFILEQSFFNHSFFKIGFSYTLNYLGRISLGLYCYHGIVITMVIKGLQHYHIITSQLQVFVIIPIIVFLSTIMLAIASHELFEKRIAVLKNKFYPA